MVADFRKSTGGNLRFERWAGTYRLPEYADLFVNATSIGLYPDVDAMPDVDITATRKDTLVAGAVFNPVETRPLRAAREHGLPALNGLSMLGYQ